jgi:polyhydroxyalkanoate synthesis regulator phasin
MPQPRSSSGRRAAGANTKGSAGAKGGKSGPQEGAPKKQASDSGPAEPIAAVFAALLDRLQNGFVLSGDRVRETLDDAVQRGRMTREDAEELAQRLVSAGRKGTEDLLSEIESLLGRGRAGVAAAARETTRQVGEADMVLRQMDRVRRAAGVGPSFPIINYDGLTAAQIVARLPALRPAELRKVRDYEKRHGNRKSVLDAVERELSKR